MLKAVFIDYTGTTVMEGGKDMQHAVMRLCKNSELHDPKEMMPIWWKTVRKYETGYKSTYLDSGEVLLKALNEFETAYGLKDDIADLHRLISGCWATAPIYSDVKEFYDNCPLPLYVITNNSVACVDKAMRLNDLHPAGIVSADSVRAYKPHKELFEKALETAAVKPQEAVHIGDSYESDVSGARAVGILPILLQREKTKKYDDLDLIVINNLNEAIAYIK